MNVNWDRVDFSIAAEGSTARVIGVIPDQLVTQPQASDDHTAFGHPVPGRKVISSAGVSDIHGAWRQGPGPGSSSGRAS